MSRLLPSTTKDELTPLKEGVFPHVQYDTSSDDNDDDDLPHEGGSFENTGGGGTTTGGGFLTSLHIVSVRMSQRFHDGYQDGFLPLVRTVSEGVQTLSHPSFVLSTHALDPDEDRRRHFRSAGTSSVVSEIANLSKNTIGGGVMSLSGGIALFANDPSAVVAATGWIVLLGTMFGYFCWLSGRACELSLSATYRECWEPTVGSSTGGIFVACATMLDPLMGIMANSAILSQSLQFTLEGIGIHLSIPEALLLIAVFALLPLCLMRNLDALAPFSAFGMSAVFVALGCMTWRWVDGSYMPGGYYHDQIEERYRPLFGNQSHPFSFQIMPFCTMAFTSFDMHYNSPRYYTELKDATAPRFGQVCLGSFGIVSFLYWSIAIVGYLTFGAHSSSYILNNYSSEDMIGTLARLCMGFSACLTYPLNFMGLRDNLLDLLGLTDQFNSDEGKLRVVTVLLLSVCVTMACFVTDLGLISAVGGGTTVALVAFVFPAFMFREAVQKHGKGTMAEKVEVGFVMTSMVTMVLVGLIGVASSIALGA
jgi:amino acid permease